MHMPLWADEFAHEFERLSKPNEYYFLQPISSVRQTHFKWLHFGYFPERKQQQTKITHVRNKCSRSNFLNVTLFGWNLICQVQHVCTVILGFGLWPYNLGAYRLFRYSTKVRKQIDQSDKSSNTKNELSKIPNQIWNRYIENLNRIFCWDLVLWRQVFNIILAKTHFIILE